MRSVVLSVLLVGSVGCKGEVEESVLLLFVVVFVCHCGVGRHDRQGGKERGEQESGRSCVMFVVLSMVGVWGWRLRV